MTALDFSMYGYVNSRGHETESSVSIIKDLVYKPFKKMKKGATIVYDKVHEFHNRHPWVYEGLVPSSGAAIGSSIFDITVHNFPSLPTIGSALVSALFIPLAYAVHKSSSNCIFLKNEK